MIIDSLSVIMLMSGAVAGFIDAIAGGSGLIMVPVFMLSGLDPQTAIATNKLCNTSGSFSSLVRYMRHGQVDLKSFKWMIVPAVAGAAVGSQLVSHLNKQMLEPIIAALLVVVTAITVFKRSFGLQTSVKEPRVFLLALVASVIGFHDGFFGPGAGIFFTFSLIYLSGLNFISATATTKALNTITSLIALVVFLAAGKVDFRLGLFAAVGIVIGSYLGAGSATRGGAKVVKPVFVGMSLVVLSKVVWASLA